MNHISQNKHYAPRGFANMMRNLLATLIRNSLSGHSSVPQKPINMEVQTKYLPHDSFVWFPCHFPHSCSQAGAFPSPDPQFVLCPLMIRGDYYVVNTPMIAKFPFDVLLRVQCDNNRKRVCSPFDKPSDETPQGGIDKRRENKN